jgi:hypothetical protein
MITTYFPILPLLILIAAGILIMLLEPFTPPARKSRLGQMAVAATALAAYALAFQWNSPPRALFHGMFLVDNWFRSASTSANPSREASTMLCCSLAVRACR